MSKSVLDDLAKIKKIDKSNMLSFCVNASEHYSKASSLADRISVDFPKPRTIIVSGMGGSAIGGDLLKDWARDRLTVPIEVCREYSLPAYADQDTLVFVISYSGETEESLSVLLDAVKRECMIVCICSGGKVCESAKRLNIPHVPVPLGMVPRATLPYLFMPLPKILEKIGLVSKVDSEVAETVRVLELVADENSPGKSSDLNFSKKLALSIGGSVPVIYGFGFYRAVAQRFKTQFNENSKVPAKWECFPELNHNEIVGWEQLNRPNRFFSIILVRDADEPVEMRYRIEATRELLQEKHLRIFDVMGEGRSRLAKMCSTVCIGDFASVYLALLHGVDPTPVKTIATMKERLGTSGVRAKVVRELQEIARKSR